MKISIPKPCNQNWSEMTPEQQGAFCKVCAKVVIDFSDMSDEEVLAYFEKKKEEKTCGRFRVSQLSPYEMKIDLRAIGARGSFRKIFAAALFIIFSSLFVCKSDTGQPLLLSTTVMPYTDTAAVTLKADTPKNTLTELFGGRTMGEPALALSIDTTRITGDTTIIEPPVLMGDIYTNYEPMVMGKMSCPRPFSTPQQSSPKKKKHKDEPRIMGRF
jgi:hypothetical protein